ncbi:MAG: hypothetical protein DMD99_24175 [Candidatus Rokuibacteriota bacterium]|nr:MAG: hypothetical protein DMD99_24175 [Candidatus Rokubacteria bacterium]
MKRAEEFPGSTDPARSSRDVVRWIRRRLAELSAMGRTSLRFGYFELQGALDDEVETLLAVLQGRRRSRVAFEEYAKDCLAWSATVHRAQDEQGLTQEALAKKAGVHRVYVAQIEGRAKVPSLATLEKLAKALRVKVGKLLE